MIRGMCYINGVFMIAIIDIGATHSFISLDCLKRLNIVVSSLNGSMVIDSPTNGSVTTMMVNLNFPVTISGKDFGIDLSCFPLSQLDIILGMNWLEFNHVHINCFNKSMLLPEFGEEEDSRFIFSNQPKKLLKDEAQVLSMFASLKVKTKDVIVELPMVYRFSDVFPDDISDFPP